MNSARFALLNTRPAQQGEALAKEIEKVGGRSYACPALQIVSLPWQVSRETSIAPLWIFTSVHALGAVSERLSECQASPSSIQLLAIGQATERALKEVLPKWHLQAPHLSFVLATRSGRQEANSEWLLAHPLVQTAIMQQQTVWVFKGEGGRTLLKDSLTQQGCVVTEWPLYRRVEAPFCESTWQAFVAAPIPLKIVLTTSVESLEAVWTGWQAADRTHEPLVLPQLPLLALSTRIAESAKEKGWLGELFVALGTSNQGILEAIQMIEEVSR